MKRILPRQLAQIIDVRFKTYDVRFGFPQHHTSHVTSHTSKLGPQPYCLIPKNRIFAARNYEREKDFHTWREGQQPEEYRFGYSAQ